MDLAGFTGDERAIFAVNHALLIISEAAAKLGDFAQEICPSIPWPEIRGLGNRLRHDYDNINFERIWLLIVKDLPALKTAVLEAIGDLESNPPAA